MYLLTCRHAHMRSRRAAKRFYGARCIFRSKAPTDAWHALVANPTVADAILDRLVHNAYRINLTASESIRKVRVRKEDSDDR